MKGKQVADVGPGTRTATPELIRYKSYFHTGNGPAETGAVSRTRKFVVGDNIVLAAERVVLFPVIDSMINHGMVGSPAVGGT